MTFGVNNVINCINQSAIRTDLTALELLQLTGSDCQFDKCAVFSAACQASLPTASCNTGRFVYITSECKYYFRKITHHSPLLLLITQNKPTVPTIAAK
jgi:hypothetical protein